MASRKKREYPRPLAFPHVRDLHDLFAFVETAAQGERRVPATTTTRGGRPKAAYMTISSYMSVNPGHRALRVRARDVTLEAIRTKTIAVPYDTISFEVILWDPTEALVLAKHSQILGSIWLAVVDPLTVPGYAPSARAAGALAHAHQVETSDAYLVAADAFLEGGGNEQDVRRIVEHAKDLSKRERRRARARRAT